MAEEKTKSTLGPTALLIILLADVGLIILGWYIYQSRRASYDDSGLSLSKAPETSSPLPFVPTVEEEKNEGSLEFVVKEKLRRRPGAPGSGSGAPAGRAPSTRNTAMRKAVLFFFDLKKDPRFKNSPAIAEWKREFLSHPDLRALDEAFRKDGDSLRFMVKMIRSPNFQDMVKRHVLKPEIQSFINEMSRAPQVLDSSKTFLEDPTISSAVRDLGLGAQGAAAEPSAGARPSGGLSQGGGEVLKKARENPTLKKYLEGEEAPAVNLK